MCSNVVKEWVTYISHHPCAIALVCCNGADCSKKCWVNCSRIVQECTNNVLDVFDLRGGERLCGVDLPPLNLCTILDWGHLLRSILERDRLGVLVLREGFIDVPRHVAIDISKHVVPG
jgi:hypothetical protein